jgi:transposase
MEKVNLTSSEREYLNEFTKCGKHKVREVNRAYMLLWLDQGLTTQTIASLLPIERTAIWRTKKKYSASGIEGALPDAPRSGQPRKYNQKEQAEIIALACSEPPEGRKRWTLALLAEKAKTIEGLETINHESIRLILKKTNVNPG